MNNNSTILIVDDDQIGRDTLEALLAKQNYNLAFASTGAEALAQAKELTPDLILLDVMMPGMDGFEVCRQLRADPILAEVPIIMVTALDDRDSRMQGIEAGADDFITKPFDRGELQMRVRTITRLNRYRRLLVANQQLEVKISQLSALYNISSALNLTIEIDTLLKSIIQKAAELLHAESVSLHFSNQANGGFPQVVGWVFREGKSALVQDISKDERFCLETAANKSLLVGSVLCVPLHGKDGVLGVIEAVNKKDSKFIQDDQRMLEAMADNIAVSIEKANLYQDLQRAEALLRRQNAALRLSVKQKYSFANIIGNSDELIAVLKKAEQVALTDSTVLIYGETGTGKELLAQAIHQISPRATRNLVALNCNAIPESLFESELFGHEKGAFTGAAARRIGRFEEANGGTLFLDEIGDMPLSAQVRLLRVLQDGVIQRLGSNTDIKVDVRLITATHRNLAQLVNEGKFRQDLYYRLRVFELRLPPLRERRGDIPLLINHFIADYNEKLSKKILGVEETALNALRNYDYPGNIRELQHLIESAMILCRGKMITLDVLPEEIQTLMVTAKGMKANAESVVIPRNNEELKAAKAEARRIAEEQVERLFLAELLSSTDGNVSEAARKSGMNRSWLAQLVSKHKLDLN
ncbi:response regulator [Candidatus Poribacteria bacterium]|nr:response regulator [Candidatus Poribacteria bacterium]